MEHNDVLNSQFSLQYYLLDNNINDDIINFAKENGLDINFIGFAYSKDSIITTNIKRRIDNGYRIITITQEETENKIIDNRRYSIDSFIQIRVHYNNIIIEISKQYDSIASLKPYLSTTFDYYYKCLPSLKYVMSIIKKMKPTFMLKDYVSKDTLADTMNPKGLKYTGYVQDLNCFANFIDNSTHYVFAERRIPWKINNVWSSGKEYVLVIIDKDIKYYYSQLWNKIHVYFTSRNIDYTIGFPAYKFTGDPKDCIYDYSIKYDKDYYINNFKKIKNIGDPRMLTIFDNINTLVLSYVHEYTFKLLPPVTTLILPNDFNYDLDIRNTKIKCLICSRDFNKKLELPKTLVYLKVKRGYEDIPNVKIEYW